MSILKTLDELTALEKLSLINMSYSRIDMFLSCQAKYFYSYIIKEPREFGPAAAMGTAVHSVLEKTDLNKLDIDSMIEQLEKEFLVEDPGNLIDTELRTAAKDMLSEFVDRHEGDVFETIGREKKFNVVIGNCYFTGFIDRIERTPSGGVLVSDWKTGKWQVAKKNVPHNLQIGLYAVVARKMYPDMWPVSGEIYYLRSGQQLRHTYTSEELDAMELKILEECNKIVNTDSFTYTKDTFTCSRMCDFGKNGTCPRGAAVIRKYSR